MRFPASRAKSGGLALCESSGDCEFLWKPSRTQDVLIYAPTLTKQYIVPASMEREEKFVALIETYCAGVSLVFERIFLCKRIDFAMFSATCPKNNKI